MSHSHRDIKLQSLLNVRKLFSKLLLVCLLVLLKTQESNQKPVTNSKQYGRRISISSIECLGQG